MTANARDPQGAAAPGPPSGLTPPSGGATAPDPREAQTRAALQRIPHHITNRLDEGPHPAHSDYCFICEALKAAPRDAEYSREDLDRLASMRERLAMATKGPWTVESDCANVLEIRVAVAPPSVGYTIAQTYSEDDEPTERQYHDTHFIAHAPDDLAWLLARLDAPRESSAVAAPEDPRARAAPPREASGGATWARTADALREFAGGEFPFNFRGGKSLWCGTHRVYHPEALCALLTRYDAERATVAPTSPVAGAPEGPHEH